MSDHEHCTALGQRVLHDHGSSVDAAVVAALCLGVVHPHVSGVGGYVTSCPVVEMVTVTYTCMCQLLHILFLQKWGDDGS